ncbi:MAG: DNA topoisomerase (ATP-hydrolyzing) [Planctomycetota bacterium]|nr:MAG: DNA topoisomerase (ATP-hydrolyzing) [Planctomycetota bacterium]
MAEADKPRESAVLIEQEMKDSYLSYAMSVIVSRALPDVRDGLKPSQRRVLVAMNDLNLGPRSKFKKCAKIAGDTSGNYHPHGESVVYPTLVRMAQDFSMRAPLVDGQGNFGSVDGDPPAAMRYTEARMTSGASALLEDIDKDTVDFVPNYDGSRNEPTVLPATFPNLLVNGSNGIAVGMATSMPPHNPREIFDALKLLIERPDATTEEILEIVPGPDFPTGGILCGQSGVRRAYETGRGTVMLRGRAECFEEEKKKRAQIVISEIPYQVNKSTLIESMAQLVKDDRVTSIYDIADLSDRTGMRILIELKKGEDPHVTLNQLYKFTQLQNTVSIINIALVANRPRTLPIKGLMTEFLGHRREVIRRRTEYLLAVARDRQHIVEGLRIAQDNIDEVIAIIRGAANTEAARAELSRRFNLSERQTEAIVNMRLRALTKLDVEKLLEEWRELAAKIERYEAILGDPKLIDALIVEDLDRLAERFADPRRTEIGANVEGFEDEDLIVDETVAVTISNQGYVKRMTLDQYRSQRRGGSGIRGGDSKDGDFIERLFLANTHDSLLFFTGSGRVHQLKVWRLPSLGRTAVGRAAVNLIPGFPEGDSIQAVIPVRDFADGTLVFSTAAGVIKRTALYDYRRPKSGGIIAISLDDGDRVIDVAVCEDTDELVLGTSAGKSIRFAVNDVRQMGRPARGVRGIKLKGDDRVCGMAIVRPDTSLLTVCANGYGKRTSFDEYSLQGRGGQGVINIRVTDRNGAVVALRAVGENDDVIYITEGGQVVRTPVAGISQIGRATQGVRLIATKSDDQVASVARLSAEMMEGEADNELDGEELPPTKGGDAPQASTAPDADSPTADDSDDEPES